MSWLCDITKMTSQGYCAFGSAFPLRCALSLCKVTVILDWQFVFFVDLSMFGERILCWQCSNCLNFTCIPLMLLYVVLTLYVVFIFVWNSSNHFFISVRVEAAMKNLTCCIFPSICCASTTTVFHSGRFSWKKRKM